MHRCRLVCRRLRRGRGECIEVVSLAVDREERGTGGGSIESNFLPSRVLESPDSPNSMILPFKARPEHCLFDFSVKTNYYYKTQFNLYSLTTLPFFPKLFLLLTGWLC